MFTMSALYQNTLCASSRSNKHFGCLTFLINCVHCRFSEYFKLCMFAGSQASALLPFCLHYPRQSGIIKEYVSDDFEKWYMHKKQPYIASFSIKFISYSFNDSLLSAACELVASLPLSYCWQT